MTDHVAAPSRERFRELRRQRRLDRRRAWVGAPLVVAGLTMIGAGTYLWMGGNTDDEPGVRVGGEVVTRTSTSTSTTSSTTSSTVLVPVELAPAISITAPAPTTTVGPGG